MKRCSRERMAAARGQGHPGRSSACGPTPAPLRSDQIYGVALRLLRNESEAEEVVEDTFWQAWRQADRDRSERGRVAAGRAGSPAAVRSAAAGCWTGPGSARRSTCHSMRLPTPVPGFRPTRLPSAHPFGNFVIPARPPTDPQPRDLAIIG